MMEQLTFNAVVEGRFKDAAFYYTLLANEILKPRPKYTFLKMKQEMMAKQQSKQRTGRSRTRICRGCVSS